MKSVSVSYPEGFKTLTVYNVGPLIPADSQQLRAGIRFVVCAIASCLALRGAFYASLTCLLIEAFYGLLDGVWLFAAWGWFRFVAVRSVGWSGACFMLYTEKR